MKVNSENVRQSLRDNLTIKTKLSNLSSNSTKQINFLVSNVSYKRTRMQSTIRHYMSIIKQSNIRYNQSHISIKTKKYEIY